MTKNGRRARAVPAGRIREEYFEWMTGLVRSGSMGKSYISLLRLMHKTEFRAVLEMDVNRAYDGVDLRYRFATERGYDRYGSTDNWLDRDCSVLEMMVALALRCEEHITGDPDLDDETGEWFFDMVASLGLLKMDDEHFEEDEAVDILDRFLRRDYEPNGRGGLFTLRSPPEDMRQVEIWYQMMRYLYENVYRR